MSAQPIRFERRSAQRFDFHLAVSITVCETGAEGSAFTQNISARGAFLYTELPLKEGDAVKVQLVMPSEITLAESMQVRCKGHVRRVSRLQDRFAVAVYLEGYEFLSDKNALQEDGCGRISALHARVHNHDLAAVPNRRSQ